MDSHSAAHWPSTYWEHTETLLSEEDDLRSGIWPVCWAVWLTSSYIALYIIRPWEVLTPRLAEIHFERFFVLLVVVIVAMERGFRCRWDRQTIAVCGFLLALGLSAINAYDTRQAWSGTAGLYVYLTTAFGYFLFASVIRTKYELTFLIATQLVAVGLYLGKSLWEFFIHGAGVRSMGVLRLQGIDKTFAHPNAVAATIVVSLPMWLFLWRMRENFTQTWPEVWQRWFRRCLWGYLGVAAVALLATNSRTGVAAAVIYGGLLVRRQSSLGRQLAYLTAFLLLIAVTWLAIPQESRDRIRSIWDSQAAGESAEESKQGRFVAFAQGMEMFRRAPFTGVGIDNFMTYRAVRLDGVRLDAHNLLAEILSQTGLVGAAAFLTMVGILMWNSWQMGQVAWPAPHGTQNYYRAFGQMSRDTILLLFVLGISSHNLYRYNWVWMAAFTATAARLCREEHEADPSL